MIMNRYQPLLVGVQVCNIASKHEKHREEERCINFSGD